MPVIKPVSDLRNYNTILQDVDMGVPVFLTKNGRGRYVLLDIADYERREASGWLASELERGWKSGEEHGWIGADEVSKEAARGQNPCLVAFSTRPKRGTTSSTSWTTSRES